ncbi:MAG: pyridoxamine 5'-phosphate oxidase family protein [Microscillaceae bacterium]|nr:pyridoxamine 5'-phosphate oxidase family protein [Microscillaceae bacterium]
MKNPLEITERTKVNRLSNRANYDREVIYQILDEAKICHISFIYEGKPVVIPTSYGRKDHLLYIHGALNSRMLVEMEKGIDISLSVTLIDGLVLARSAFHHSMNYRSVVIFDQARLLSDFEEKKEALRIITNHLVPARWEECREINRGEIEGTKVLTISIEEASAKIRTGGPKDAKPDYQLPIWAGVIPCKMQYGEFVEDSEQHQDAVTPESVKNFYL